MRLAGLMVSSWAMLGSLGCGESNDSEPDQTVGTISMGGNAPGAGGGATGGSGGGAAGLGVQGAAGTEGINVSGPLASGGAGAASSGSGASQSSLDAGSTPETPDTGVAVTCPALSNATAGDSNRSVTVGGMNRTYVLHVPPGYTGERPVPVVFDFHGFGGTGAGQRNFTGWAALADQEGFIAVFPNGFANAWNVGRCCPGAEAVDDVAFVRAMITQLQADACIDTRRIFATGCSNGGGMSYKLACEAADVIAAVAPVDFDCVVGPQNVPSCGGCNPARPITEIQFRATNDQLVAYEGGQAPIPPTMDFPGAEANLADWGEINQCTGTPEVVAETPACQTFPACGGGVETTLCTQQGGSHCGNYQSLDIVNVAWQAFLRSPLP